MKFLIIENLDLSVLIIFDTGTIKKFYDFDYELDD
jgi:hypothetical protein